MGEWVEFTGDKDLFNPPTLAPNKSRYASWLPRMMLPYTFCYYIPSDAFFTTSFVVYQTRPFFTFTVISGVCRVYVCLLPLMYTSLRMFDSPTLVSPNTVIQYVCYM